MRRLNVYAINGVVHPVYTLPTVKRPANVKYYIHSVDVFRWFSQNTHAPFVGIPLYKSPVNSKMEMAAGLTIDRTPV